MMMTLLTILNKALRKHKKIASIEGAIFQDLQKAQDKLKRAERMYENAKSINEVARAAVMAEQADKEYRYFLELYRKTRGN